MEVKLCDLCNKEPGEIQASLITGKRGKPPRRDYCPACFEAESKAGRCRTPGHSLSKEEREQRKAERERKREENKRFKEAARVKSNKKKTKKVRQIIGLRYSAAEFLFEDHRQYDNAFEPADASEWGDKWTFRCKGCGAILIRPERKEHWHTHRGEEIEVENIPEISEEIEIEEVAA